MERIAEPELMDDAAQAHAYAQADFAEPHDRFVTLFGQMFPGETITGRVLDLGCGTADVTIRFARAHAECAIDALDGAAAMLEWARRGVDAAGLAPRVRLLHGRLPGAVLPQAQYDAVISNSLLHHLADPMVLWRTIVERARHGAPIFIMDLMRPDSVQEAHRLVDEYAAGEAQLLRRDFFHSLLAAYRPEEIRAQLRGVGLDLQVEVVGDRHLAVGGRTR